MRLSFLFRQGQFRSRSDLDRELSVVADYNLDADRQVRRDLRDTDFRALLLSIGKCSCSRAGPFDGHGG